MKCAATLSLIVALVLSIVSCTDGTAVTNHSSDTQACEAPPGSDQPAQSASSENTPAEAPPDADSDAEDIPVLRAWAALEVARVENERLRDSLSGLSREMETERGERAAREVVMFALGAGCAMLDEAEDKFREAFDASAWGHWDGDEHAAMFREGLLLSARHSLDRQPAMAVVTCELFVEKFPDDARADAVRYMWLPIALSAAENPDDAIKRLFELQKVAEESYRPHLMMSIADLHALKGEITSARDAYRVALRMITIAGPLERDDPRHSTKRDVDMRLALIGKEAPDISSEQWFGTNVRRLSILGGKVIVLDYWATW